jgi:hypothetical protein
MHSRKVPSNRHGLVVNPRLTQASGNAEPLAALAMAAKITSQGRVNLGADQGYDQKQFVRKLREHRVTPYVAQKANSAIDRRSTPATGSASGGANEWKGSSAGSRRSPDCARLVIVESPASVGPSPSRPRPTTW